MVKILLIRRLMPHLHVCMYRVKTDVIKKSVFNPRLKLYNCIAFPPANHQSSSIIIWLNCSFAPLFFVYRFLIERIRSLNYLNYCNSVLHHYVILFLTLEPKWQSLSCHQCQSDLIQCQICSTCTTQALELKIGRHVETSSGSV